MKNMLFMVISMSTHAHEIIDGLKLMLLFSSQTTFITLANVCLLKKVGRDQNSRIQRCITVSAAVSGHVIGMYLVKKLFSQDLLKGVINLSEASISTINDFTCLSSIGAVVTSELCSKTPIASSIIGYAGGVFMTVAINTINRIECKKRGD